MRQISSSVASSPIRVDLPLQALELARRASRRRAAGGSASVRAARAAAARAQSGASNSLSSRASVGAQLGARHDRVDVAEAEVLLGAAEVVGELLARDLLHDARAGEGHERVRLGERDVAERREAREHAAGRRVRHHAEERAAGVAEVLDGATVFGSCMSARIPSCMRAPPELVTATSGIAALGRGVAGARELLADDAAHRAAHEGEVHDGELALPRRRSRRGRSPSRRRARSSSPPRRAARCTGAGRRSRADPRSAAPSASSTKVPGSASGRDARPRAHREVVPALARRPRGAARARRRGSASDSSDRCSGGSAGGSAGRPVSTETSILATSELRPRARESGCEAAQ